MTCCPPAGEYPTLEYPAGEYPTGEPRPPGRVTFHQLRPGARSNLPLAARSAMRAR